MKTPQMKSISRTNLCAIVALSAKTLWRTTAPILFKMILLLKTLTAPVLPAVRIIRAQHLQLRTSLSLLFHRQVTPINTPTASPSPETSPELTIVTKTSNNCKDRACTVPSKEASLVPFKMRKLILSRQSRVHLWSVTNISLLIFCSLQQITKQAVTGIYWLANCSQYLTEN
jgi:hypothetical protein